MFGATPCACACHKKAVTILVGQARRLPAGNGPSHLVGQALPLAGIWIPGGKQECLPYNSNPIRYGQSDQCETNPARTGFSRVYSHFSSADSSSRNRRSKQTGCHCQSAFSALRTRRLIAADSSPTAASLSGGPANK